MGYKVEVTNIFREIGNFVTPCCKQIKKLKLISYSIQEKSIKNIEISVNSRTIAIFFWSEGESKQQFCKKKSSKVKIDKTEFPFSKFKSSRTFKFQYYPTKFKANKG